MYGGLTGGFSHEMLAGFGRAVLMVYPIATDQVSRVEGASIQLAYGHAITKGIREAAAEYAKVVELERGKFYGLKQLLAVGSKLFNVAQDETCAAIKEQYARSTARAEEYVSAMRKNGTKLADDVPPQVGGD